MTVTERIMATAQLGGSDALALARAADAVHVAKGVQRVSFDMAERPTDDELLARMLGPTGNMRAPTLRIGRQVLVGFNGEMYAEALGIQL